MKAASYTLPDGSVIIDPRKPKSPSLLAALQNPHLQGVSYTLPDGTVIIDPRKPLGPDLSKVGLSFIMLQYVFYLVEVGPAKTVNPLQSPIIQFNENVLCQILQVLLNQNLRKKSFSLPYGSNLVVPGQKPNLGFALRQNMGLRTKGLYQLSNDSGLSAIPQPTLRSALRNDDLRGLKYRCVRKQGTEKKRPK